MKGPEITALIDRDLYEDAFARQREEHVPYRAQRRAEGIERGFFICPKCGELGKTLGVGNTVLCACGMKLYYTEEGFFDPPEPVETLAEWESVQREALRKLCESAQDALFSDPDMRLREIGAGHRQTSSAGGRSRCHGSSRCGEGISRSRRSTAWPWSRPTSCFSPPGSATMRYARRGGPACGNTCWRGSSSSKTIKGVHNGLFSSQYSALEHRHSARPHRRGDLAVQASSATGCNAIRSAMMPVAVMAGFLLLILKYTGLIRIDGEIMEILVYHCLAMGFIAMSSASSAKKGANRGTDAALKSGRSS